MTEIRTSIVLLYKIKLDAHNVLDDRCMSLKYLGQGDLHNTQAAEGLTFVLCPSFPGTKFFALCACSGNTKLLRAHDVLGKH